LAVPKLERAALSWRCRADGRGLPLPDS